MKLLFQMHSSGSFLEHISTAPSVLHAAIALVSAIFSISTCKDNHKRFAFTWLVSVYTFKALPQGYFTSPVLCHNIVHRDPDRLEIPQNISMVHYIDDIMLNGSGEQEATSTLDALVRHKQIKSMADNPTKIQGPATSVKSPGAQWSGLCQDVLSKVKVNWLCPHHLSQTKGAKCLVGLFGSNINHIWMSCFYPSIKSPIRLPASRGPGKLISHWAWWPSSSNDAQRVCGKQGCCTEPLEGHQRRITLQSSQIWEKIHALLYR